MRINGEEVTVQVHASPPLNPVKGDMFYSPDGRAVIYTGHTWHTLRYRPKEEKMDNVDTIMTTFSHTINNHPDMNVKVQWYTNSMPTREFREKNNHPDFWAGLAVAAHEKKVIDRGQFTDILLALKAKGASSDHFNNIVKQLALGKI